MFNSGETGQNRTARGAVHNDCPAYRVFPFRVPLPVLHPARVCGSSVFFFLRSLGFSCGISATIPALLRLRSAVLLLSIVPADSFTLRVRRWCPVPVLFMPDSIRIKPGVLLTPALSLRAAPVSFAPLLHLLLCPCSCGLMRYAATRSAGSLILCYSCRSLSVLSKSGSSGGREQRHFLLELTPAGRGEDSRPPCCYQCLKELMQRYYDKLTLQNPLIVNKLRAPLHYTTLQQKTLTI